jgi:hypothetical protein
MGLMVAALVLVVAVVAVVLAATVMRLVQVRAAMVVLDTLETPVARREMLAQMVLVVGALLLDLKLMGEAAMVQST